ncbi:chitin deacetylase, partial [Ceratobasidium sp. 423]
TLPTLNNGVISLQHDWYQGTVDLAVGYFLPAALSHNPAPNFQSVIECQHQPLGMSYVETSGSGVSAAGSTNNATTTPAPSGPAGSSTKASAPTSGSTKTSTTGTPSGTASASSANASVNAAVTTRDAMSGLFVMAVAAVVSVLGA